VSNTDSKRRSTSILHAVIREELAAREWSLSQLAERLGVRLGVVSRWLSEAETKRVVPLPQACVQLAQALDMDVIEVFRLAGYLPPMEQPHEAHPHQDEIRSTQRRLGRILKSIPAAEWPRSYPVVVAYLDGLQLILNRLDGNE
jgi:transcriptional regulator with XRE-family HTH domain